MKKQINAIAILFLGALFVLGASGYEAPGGLGDALESAVDDENSLDQSARHGHGNGWGHGRCALRKCKRSCRWKYDNKEDRKQCRKNCKLIPGLTPEEGALATSVITRAEAVKIEDTWGELDLHYNEVSTWGTEKMVTGIADINPGGQQIHPPHVHEEEEFLYVATGSGVWTVGEDVFPAKAGDLLYPVPHDLHGVTNTGTENLSFYFFKWNNRGVAPPEAGKVEQAIETLATQVISIEDAEHISDVWGELYLYTNGAKTFGMENVTTGIAELLPGMEIHPPHVHVEEEFLYIVSGSGTWTVNGEDFAAEQGDLLYAEPWGEPHGIKNTGTEDLVFYFIKWENQNIAVPIQD